MGFRYEQRPSGGFMKAECNDPAKCNELISANGKFVIQKTAKKNKPAKPEETPLLAPSMNFDKAGTESKKVKSKTTEQPLGLPKW